MISALIFDFDGVLIESEWVGNAQIAEWLSAAGHPTTTRQALDAFTGLSGRDFTDAIERWIDGPLPAGFAEARAVQDAQCMADGVDAVLGAVAFVRALPPTLPRAVASSSSSAWIRRHLDHIGLGDGFGDMIFSGREHVSRGKPAPDIYLHAAAALDVPIGDCVIIEDSLVGVTGALASGARVIGLAAGRHCDARHVDALRARGVTEIAADFEELAALLALDALA